MRDVDGPFDIDAQIPTHLIGAVELIESLNDNRHTGQPTQTFLLLKEETFQMFTARMKSIKGATKHTLATIQKFGQKTKSHNLSSMTAPVFADATDEMSDILLSKENLWILYLSQNAG